MQAVQFCIPSLVAHVARQTAYCTQVCKLAETVQDFSGASVPGNSRPILPHESANTTAAGSVAVTAPCPALCIRLISAVRAQSCLAASSHNSFWPLEFAICLLTMCRQMDRHSERSPA
jgi:hypothetical protein